MFQNLDSLNVLSSWGKNGCELHDIGLSKVSSGNSVRVFLYDELNGMIVNLIISS